MMRCVFAIPGDIQTPTGGYAYARKIIPHLKQRISLDILALPAGFPNPSAADLEKTRARFSSSPAPHIVLADGLAYGALPESIIHAIRSPIVALVHHPLCLEEGLSAADKDRLHRSEGAALALARHIVVPSPPTAEAVARLFGIGENKITIAEPGVLRGARASGASRGAPLHIVSVGTLTPRKGFPILIEALRGLGDLSWRATFAGSLDLAPQTTSTVLEQISTFRLGDRITLAGALTESDVSALYSSGDIFALTSLYEGYGMAFAEAMAHGLPVVASGEGAVATTVPKRAGFVCPVRDAGAIEKALRILMTNDTLRLGMAEAAFEHGQTLPSWVRTADIIAAVLEQFAQ
jgi:glycosyltransferase involved in cell wall biosynthesis